MFVIYMGGTFYTNEFFSTYNWQEAKKFDTFKEAKEFVDKKGQKRTNVTIMEIRYTNGASVK